MKKIYNIIALALGIVGHIQGQQLPQYSMYMLNQYGYHSAYAGLDGSVSITGVFRKQWVSFPGTPLGFEVNAHLPVAYLRSGFGLSVGHDRLGAEVNTGLRLSYNYIADMGKAGKLSIGGAGSWQQKGIDGTILRAPDGNYEGGGINHNDDYIPSIKSLRSTFSAEASVYYKHRLIEAAVSVHHLPAPLLTWTAGTNERVRYVQHLTGMLSGDIPLTEDFSLRPSVLIKTDFLKVQGELALLLNYKKFLYGGLGFRGYSRLTQDAVVVMVGADFAKHFRLAYAYDISVSKLRTFNSGSHEVILNYNLGKEIGKGIPPKIIYNPRFL